MHDINLFKAGKCGGPMGDGCEVHTAGLVRRGAEQRPAATRRSDALQALGIHGTAKASKISSPLSNRARAAPGANYVQMGLEPETLVACLTRQLEPSGIDIVTPLALSW